MNLPIGNFEIVAKEGSARTGILNTAHGVFETPAFMPVATQGTVKGMTPRDLREIGAQIVLSNTYHLHLRPGEELISRHGGLHKFMNWDGPILTDSGGYQVFSLAALRELDADGVSFRSHIDGSEQRFTPESVIGIQEKLGVDIMMVLDECLPYPCDPVRAANSLDTTISWARRSREARKSASALAFGIIQGGMHKHLRERSVKETIDIGFDGYAIGGLSVGEPIPTMYELVEFTAPLLPFDRPRYLMGVGTPQDIVFAVANGVDMFDCVMPTRSARFGRLFTGTGHINIRNSAFRDDANPIEIGCECYTCKNFSRAYLSHLIHAREVLATHLATFHNLFFYQRLMRSIRSSIKDGTFHQLMEQYGAVRSPLGDER